MSSDPGLVLAPAEFELETARRMLRDGCVAEADQAFRRVLAGAPEQVEALRFMARAALGRGAAGEAVDLLNRAANVDRNDIGTLMELGVAYRVAERMDASRYVFERVLELSEGRNTAARLLLANVLELDQRPELALPQYFRAILDAQHAGRWRDDHTTEPRLGPLVRHAMQYAAEGRRALFQGALQPWRQHVDMALMARIDRALAVYLRESSEPPADSRQRAGLLHIPGLGKSPSIDAGGCEWLPILLPRLGKAMAEIEACLARTSVAADNASLSFDRGAETGIRQASERRTDIYRSGTVPDSIRRLAPQLLAALGDTPLLRIPRHSPDAALIAVPAGVRTPVHYGCSNCRCTVVVGLPGEAQLEVLAGGESYQADAGNGMLFDGSYGIEYVNRGAAEARALVFDVWHPGLGPAEQQALSAVISTMVDFDMRLQELT